jgi:hypothetical protein
VNIKDGEASPAARAPRRSGCSNFRASSGPATIRWPDAMEAYHEALHQHVHDFFAEHPSSVHVWDNRNVGQRIPDFHVIEIGPADDFPLWTYVTVGAGTVKPPDGRRLEFVLCSATPGEQHVRLLTMIVYFHTTGETLDTGHVAGFGEPWIPGSRLDCVLITDPSVFEDDFEIFDHDDFHVHILWAVPITRAERALALSAGYEHLESLFEEQDTDYADPFRDPVVDET